MEKICGISESFNLELNNFKDFEMVRKISSTSDELDIAVLGKDLILKLLGDQNFVDVDSEDLIKAATELVSRKAYRNEFTVPVVSGETDYYCYSTYDSLDDSLLLSGSYTDSCFRVGGNDNDFLHYCALDKNGVVLKITDKKGNFIARAGGFRNGNCVFFNQLRTIYDRSGNDYSNEQKIETAQIIEAFRKACKHIARISQENPDEKKKIDHVFVTRSYSMSTEDPNTSAGLRDTIGDIPMDVKSKDWEYFLENTNNLDDCGSYGFSTDYGSYHVICMASIKDPMDIRRSDLKPGDVPPLYTRKRSPVTATIEITQELINKLNKIKGSIAKITDIEFEPVNIPAKSLVFSGDNWYLVYHDGKIIESHYAFDKYAEREANVVASMLLDGTFADTKTPVHKLVEDHIKQVEEEAKKAKNEIKIKRIRKINKKTDE